MKKTIYIFIASVALLLLSGCDQFLSIQPKGILIPKTVEEYEALLNDAGFMKVAEAYPVYLSDDAYVPDDDETGYLIGYNTTEQYIKNLYSFNEKVFGPSEEDGFWVYSYNRIYTYNVLVNRIMDATEGTEERKKSIKAEALMGRALEYLYLVNAYAVHYDKATASKDLGVPLVLSIDEKPDHLTRATVQEVYDLIINDLTEAVKYLPMKPSLNAFRASKSAGLGILSRAYLYMGEYDKALKYANESLEVNNALLNLNDYEVVNPTGALGRTNVPGMTRNPENIYLRLAPWVFGISGSVYPSKDLLELFTPNDRRLQLYYTTEPYGLTTETPIWLQYLETNLAISTPEVYLTAAECEARIGSKDKAMQLLNGFRDHRFANNTALVAGSKEEALKMVLEERRRELAFQGPLRLYDLKRFNKQPGLAKKVTRVIQGKTHTLEPNSPKYVLPIPATVLRFNPGMPDNIR